MSKPLDYDAADDGVRSSMPPSSKRLRGDDYYLRQPDDPGVDDDREPAARPFSWRLIIGLFALQLAVIGAFVWVVMR